MSKQIISVETGRQYFLDRVKELKNQVPNGDPFVFLGTFAVLNAVGRLFNSSIYDLLNKFADFDENEAETVQAGARFMFESFTLTAPVYEDRVAYSTERVIKEEYWIQIAGAPERVHKLNLSHKDRQHKSHEGGKLTLSAGAFLEDVEGVINTVFSSIEGDEVAGAKVFVKLNETPLIGYGE